MIAIMPDDRQFMLRQIDQARGDLYGIADDLEPLKMHLVQLPTRAYISRLAMMATGRCGRWSDLSR